MNKSINTSKYKINFSDQGKGTACIILHGYLESLETFTDLACELAQSSRVICIDLPGHGNSDLKQANVSIEDMAECVSRVIQYLDIDKVHMLGHSMGGYVALAFADRYPDKLLSFTFLHSTANADTEEKRFNRIREIEFIRKGKKELICNTAIPNTFSKHNQETFADEIDVLKKIALSVEDEGVVVALKAMMNRPDRNQTLRDLSVPKYSFIGKDDNFIPFEKGMEWASANGMNPVVFEKSGHMSFIEEKEKCVEAILQILDLG